jgi:hypothetical protein
MSSAERTPSTAAPRFVLFCLPRRVESPCEVRRVPLATERVKLTDWRGAVCATPGKKERSNRDLEAVAGQTGKPAVPLSLTRAGLVPLRIPAQPTAPTFPPGTHFLSHPGTNPPAPRPGASPSPWIQHPPDPRQARQGRASRPIASTQRAPRISVLRCQPALFDLPLPCRPLLPPRSLQGSTDQQHSFPPAWDLPEDPFSLELVCPRHTTAQELRGPSASSFW